MRARAEANILKLTDHEVMSDAVELATYDPDWFCNTILRSPNDPWQSEGLNAIADLDRIRAGIPTLYNHDGLNRFSFVAFHGPGKTHFMAKAGHWWNFTRKGRIPCTAPKEKQLITRLWPEFRKIRRGALPAYQSLMEIGKTQITWCGDVDWCALVEAASQPENLAGYHDDWIMFLVEEASGVDEEMFPVIEGALTTPGAVAILIGNPTRSVGEFWASHNKPGTMELYYKKAIKPEDSPRIDPKWVDGMIRKYGRSSAVVKIRVLGEFVEADENQLFSLLWLEDARNRDFEEDGSFPQLRVSVDVADGGIDDSIITVAKRYQSFIYYIKQHQFNFPPSVSPIEVADAAQRIWEANGGKASNGDDIVVDSIGVGAGTAGTLIKRGIPTIAYKGGESSDDPKMWRNRRTQTHLAARDAFREGLVVIAHDFIDDPQDMEEFLAQMCSIRTAPGVERVEDLETKISMKARGLKSPDRAESAVMQFATQKPSGPTGIYFTPEVQGSMENHYDASIT